MLPCGRQCAAGYRGMQEGVSYLVSKFELHWPAFVKFVSIHAATTIADSTINFPNILVNFARTAVFSAVL